MYYRGYLARMQESLNFVPSATPFHLIKLVWQSWEEVLKLGISMLDGPHQPTAILQRRV